MKKKIIFILTIMSLIYGINSCKSREKVKSSQSKVHTEHNSKNALEWEGSYMGIIPCADCPGIQIQITLLSDNTYKMRMKYEDKETSGNNYEGTFQWNSTGNAITLNNLDKNEISIYYQIGENILIQLDTEGNIITGEGEQNYVLVKVDTNLLDKRWKLVGIFGRPVPEPKTSKYAHITFQLEDSRVYGNTSCNSFSGSYQLKTDNRLSFGEMISTRVMCFNNMDTETKMNEVFRLTDSYVLSGDTLILNKVNKEPIALFKAE
jgi:heat shock protein HslJ